MSVIFAPTPEAGAAAKNATTSIPIDARGFVAAYSTLGLLKLRLGALPEADAAARVALQVLRESDLRAGLAFAVTVLADIAVEAGELVEAEALLSLLPQQGWPAGVGTVLIPAARQATRRRARYLRSS